MIDLITSFLDDNHTRWTFVNKDDIIFRDEFTAKCQMNYCGRYNKSWTCPPAIGNIDSIKKKCLHHSQAILFSMIFPLEDPYDVEGMDFGRNTIMQITYDLFDMVNKSGMHTAFLAAGSCSLCEKCTYPNFPCRHPEKAMISMEALGIDVAVLARKSGLKYYNGVNTVTYFAMIFFDEV
ncbi:MAG: DUF2284 domain-containing protein [Candidatus Izemoplasmatales bacterium]|jgi:predicted metal-binding protein